MSHNVGKTWWPGSLPGEIRSHDDKQLKQHLTSVASISKQLTDLHGINVDTDLLTVVGWTHDLGKVHPTFQAYLEGAPDHVEHSRPSAYFALSLIDDPKAAFVAAELVRRHHTGLEDVEEAVSFWAGDRVNYRDINMEMRKLLPEWPALLTEDKWNEFLDFLNLDLEVDAEFWLRFRTLFSLLITADRMDAVGVSEMPCQDLPGFTLPTFKKDGEMNRWRAEVREKCLRQVPEVVEPGIYTLTLPTGAGKTVTGLQIAREFAARRGAKSIIYALPFIAIVEQNAKVAREVFGSACVQEDHSGVFSQEEDAGTSRGAALQKMSGLFRYWTEPVVVTTLAALWRACFDSRANATMNFHRLYNSIVVLDEPQSIRPELWRGLGKAMKLLAERCGVVFLLMTATQPLIGTGMELAQDVTPFPKSRHTYQFLSEKYSIGDLLGLLESHLPLRDGSGMVVLNTKKSAFQAWRLLKERLDGPVLFLSRSMAPLHRRRTLEQLQKLRERRCRHYLVATQVVEAGVDLDFDWVFRDMGPLDSVIQVAGRCNRHFNPNICGRVLVAELVDSDNRPFHSYVYSEILTHATREILARYGVFTEHEVADMVKEYYLQIDKRRRPESFYEDICEGKWRRLPELIEAKDFREVPVFVELDDGLMPLLKGLEETERTLATQERLRRLWARASQYMIEVPVKSLLQCAGAIGKIRTTDKEPPLRTVFGERYWLISKEAIGVLYDPVAGYVHPSLLEDDIGNRMF